MRTDFTTHTNLMPCRCALAVLMFSLTLAGCGTGLDTALQVNSVTGFEASSIFSPAGHSIAELPGGRFRITAMGSPSTPRARVEKIAVARAADFGLEQKKKFFQTSAPQSSIRCGKRDYIEKGEKKKLPAKGYTVVEVDVAYADTATDPGFRLVHETADTLKAELLAEVVPDDVRAQTANEVRAQCGG